MQSVKHVLFALIIKTDIVKFPLIAYDIKYITFHYMDQKLTRVSDEQDANEYIKTDSFSLFTYHSCKI
jgi:hypothetical protein